MIIYVRIKVYCIRFDLSVSYESKEFGGAMQVMIDNQQSYQVSELPSI